MRAASVLFEGVVGSLVCCLATSTPHPWSPKKTGTAASKGSETIALQETSNGSFGPVFHSLKNLYKHRNIEMDAFLNPIKGPMFAPVARSFHSIFCTSLRCKPCRFIALASGCRNQYKCDSSAAPHRWLFLVGWGCHFLALHHCIGTWRIDAFSILEVSPCRALFSDSVIRIEKPREVITQDSQDRMWLWICTCVGPEFAVFLKIFHWIGTGLGRQQGAILKLATDWHFLLDPKTIKKTIRVRINTCQLRWIWTVSIWIPVTSIGLSISHWVYL